MNAKNLIAAVAVLTAAGSSFASEITPWPAAENFKSTKTRAEVVAELKEAQASGAYVVGGTAQPELVPVLAATQQKTRAEVYQDILRAKADGTYVVGGREIDETSAERYRATQHAGKGANMSNTVTQ